eukprot:3271260-Rhodomonas_salina.2
MPVKQLETAFWSAGGRVCRWGDANAVCLCWSRGWYLRVVFQSVEEMSSGLTRAAESATPLKKRVEWRELLSGNWSG